MTPKFHTKKCFGVIWNSQFCDCGGMYREAQWIHWELRRGEWERCMRFFEPERQSLSHNTEG